MRVFTLALAVAILALLAPIASPLGAAANFIRVPQDSPTLATAIPAVADGGVIEMAGGVYPSPANGFAINNARKGFTVRAVAGAGVVLDGGGSRPLVRMVNSDRSRGKRVTFEGITFQNGVSTSNNVAGGVTLGKAEATFRNCAFVSNRTEAPSTGGGAVKVLEGSSVSFFNCSFRDNSSPNRGGALAVRAGADVTVQGGEFLRNRVNLPGHKTNSAGGAIWVLDGTLRVSGTLFDSNEAGFVGGAIYAIGNWDKGANVLVTGSTFRNNQAQADPCCAIASPTTGGALHAEDLTTLRVHQSLFLLNRADFGGAVDDYRAVVEIDGSVLRGNQSTRARPGRGAGGAISALSPDFPDSSTQNGAINRRPARLVVAQSLLQGGSEVGTAPTAGGCVLASGDTPRVYGGTGVPLIGSVAENRAQLEVRGTVFLDCDVSTPVGDGNGNGGAIAGDMLDLVMEDSMILDSDARGPGSTGGGISLRQQSAARIARSTFSRSSAELWGGAISAVGSTLQVSDSRFFRNRVAPGKPVFNSLGASILASPSTDPARPENVSGVVSGSIFSDDEGISIADVISNGGANGMLYVGNRFNPTAFDDKVYINTQEYPNGTNVDGLNAVMARRGGNVTPNVRVFNPREGALRAVPSVNAVGAGAPSPTASYLAYAFVGSSAVINGTGLSQPDGLLEVGPGDYSLTVNGTPAATAKVSGTCTAGSFLCLGNNRFRAELTWKANGVASPAQAVALSNDTGYFYFTDPANVELVVKVLDARSFNGFFWVFYGGLTNLEYTMTVTDTVTGFVRVYTNPSGRFASNGDTIAFPAASSAASSLPVTAGAADDLEVVTAAASTCAGGPAALCLSGSRFRAELSWKSAGQTHTAQAVPLSGDTGYFYFLSPSNVEVIVKVLDARTFNNRFWVFYGALSNLEYTLTVTDTQTGRVKTYHNPDGTFASQGDTSAFPGP
ncbi:MAG: hypothetical protein QOF89_3004 [Acidobacteriota bacterium]|nr:hypothetical protein [Acidobacteriota bacterium]